MSWANEPGRRVGTIQPGANSSSVLDPARRLPGTGRNWSGTEPSQLSWEMASEGTTEMSGRMEGTTEMSGRMESTTEMSGRMEGATEISGRMDGATEMSGSMEGATEMSGGMQQQQLNGSNARHQLAVEVQISQTVSYTHLTLPTKRIV
eukprot:TRINITY_DN7140_c0_g2_i1.p3 TRINITY_DN7140_c0_g2~~TRINITY_DN7140_c0_g2_i1.p3  ORF type:complete len:149 (-),score=23.49 TRINITY_DN7140_c0_g2_i1:56-502(-)